MPGSGNVAGSGPGAQPGAGWRQPAALGVACGEASPAAAALRPAMAAAGTGPEAAREAAGGAGWARAGTM